MTTVATFLRRARAEAERYGDDPWVFVRELIQNARDAGARRVTFTVQAQPGGGSLIEIGDDGEGMTWDHATSFLFTLYASSKASVSIITECLAAQFSTQHPQLQATIFYPAGGVLDTGIWTCARNRPEEFAREKPSGQPEDLMGAFMSHAKETGMDVQFQDLDDLAKALLVDLKAGKFVAMIGVEGAGETLRTRSEKIGKGEAPFDEHSLIA